MGSQRDKHCDVSALRVKLRNFMNKLLLIGATIALLGAGCGARTPARSTSEGVSDVDRTPLAVLSTVAREYGKPAAEVCKMAQERHEKTLARLRSDAKETRSQDDATLTWHAAPPTDAQFGAEFFSPPPSSVLCGWFDIHGAQTRRNLIFASELSERGVAEYYVDHPLTARAGFLGKIEVFNDLGYPSVYLIKAPGKEDDPALEVDLTSLRDENYFGLAFEL